MYRTLQLLLPRILGALVAIIATMLARRGIALEPELQGHLTELLIGVGLLAYAAVHKSTSVVQQRAADARTPQVGRDGPPAAGDAAAR